ncbi:FGGY family carbohydrate kinase [Corallincola spongiicola]|uniref:Glycerol kinase n=1 Tax=Corallincola spongiicola TaxID=2520508 RepID=A0ABY1WS07_9GAMM|nr:FGGY family carbohydrate kinase [Corallincola spongiicola]TAA47515.1 hypothetical protein EXY25_09855 [Corallincola spongiicola]
MPLFLILDQGGQSVRALVVDHQGNVVTRAQHAIATHYGSKGHIEQNADAIARDIKQCALRAVQKLSIIQRQQLRSAGLVTQRASLLAVNANSQQVLTPVMSWQDIRGGGNLRKVAMTTSELRSITGLRLSPHYGVAKMRWSLKHNHAVNKAAEADELMFTPIASFLIQQLTGGKQYQTDAVNASRTLLMDHINCQWSAELLEKFAIKQQWLPTICANDEYYGEIQLGNLSLPLHYVNGDQATVLFSRGKPSPTTLSINVGTGAFISRVTDGDDTALLRSLVHHGKEQFRVLEGTVNGAATAIQQVISEVTTKQGSQSDLLAQVNGQINNIPLFLNGIGGLGAPFWLPGFNSEFQHPESLDGVTPVAKLTAVIESVAFLLQIIIQRLSAHPPTPTKIEICGGLSRLDYLCQTLANISGMEVFREQEVEGSALGCAWWLAGSPADWRNAEVTSQFVPQHAPALSQRFSAWQEAMRQRLPADKAAMMDSQPQTLSPLDACSSS